MWDCRPHPAPVFPLIPFLLAEAWSDGLWIVLVIFERGDMGWANPLTGKKWIPKEDSRLTGWERHSFCVYVFVLRKDGTAALVTFRMHSLKTVGSILPNWPVVCSSILGQRQSSVWSSGPFFLPAFCLLVSYCLRHPHVIETFSPSSPIWGLPCGSAGEESACSAGDLGSIPGLGRWSPGEGQGCPLQYSGLENSMDCIVHGVGKSRTWPSDFHFTLSPVWVCKDERQDSCSGGRWRRGGGKRARGLHSLSHCRAWSTFYEFKVSSIILIKVREVQTQRS